ncbi:MAG: S-layer homology domain-containing protein [Clostridia bacterium]|nr:S-layer homology domain-containing protein [Clostridia bacterium]
MKKWIMKTGTLLLAVMIAISVSGCGVLTTTKKIIEKDETQTQETDNQIIENYELATLVPASDILADIPYIGDRSICKMDKAMALAYKDAIESMPAHVKDYPDYNLCALLADPAGDGMPILITAYVHPEKYEYSYCDKDYGNFVEALFWEYRNGKAKKVEIKRPDTNGFGKIGNKTYYRNVEFFHDVGPKRTGLYYLIENATITLKHTIDIYGVITDSYNGPGYGDLPEGATYGRTPGELGENGWKVELNTFGSATAFLCIHNGKNITDTCTQYDHDAIAQFTQTMDFVHSDDQNYHLEVKTDKGTSVAEKLEKYSKSVGRPTYRYSQVATELANEKIGGIVKAVEGIISGRIGEIYQLSDDLYYVIMYADEELAGGVLVKNTNSGKSWRVVSSDNGTMTEAELDNATASDLREPNITIDTKAENVTEALKNAIANVDGTAINDAAKNKIADYVSDCIAQAGKRNVKASRNTIKINEKAIKKCIKEANEKKAEITEVLDESDVALNKVLFTDVLIECENISDDKEVKVVFDGDIINQAENFQFLTIKINGTPYSVMMNSEKLAEIANKTIGIEKTGEDTYVIRYTDENGQIVEHIGNGITITLPADNEFCTIRLEYKGGTDNWGGQYDANTKSIIFGAPYSGTYTVLDNKTQIADIDGMDEEHKKAVEFLVSKGYMTLDGEKFNPGQILTRYQFTQALVGMFFALDREVKTTFTDVAEDSVFYPYVASAQKDEIVEGFTDTEFAGDMNMTTEQMVALAGRTLMKYKGYTAPEDAESYLAGFTDNAKISDWARELVAISVREGLVDRTSEFKPQSEITREQAALILYRLFLLLYETEASAESAATSLDVTKIVVVSICSVVVIVCIVAIIILLRKRKK